MEPLNKGVYCLVVLGSHVILVFLVQKWSSFGSGGPLSEVLPFKVV